MSGRIPLSRDKSPSVTPASHEESSPAEHNAQLRDASSVSGGGYIQIFRASAMIGGATAIGVLLGLVRTKVLALLLGPVGIGLFGIYGAIVDLAATVAGLGVGSSGVRQVAEAAGHGEIGRIGATTVAVRRLSIGLGVCGAVTVAVLSSGISAVTFGTNAHALAVMVLACAVLLRCIAAGEAALLQGLRRIPELAITAIAGAVGATIGSIALVWWLGPPGIAPSIVLTAAAGLAATMWFSRRVRGISEDRTRDHGRELYSGLLALGAVFMVSALAQQAGAYVVRAATVREISSEAAGHYHAAWTIGSMYVGMILAAMATDFYPRLVAAMSDPQQCNRIVNEQVRASLLIAGPGVLATLTFSSLALTLLYSPAFLPASETLRWICAGMALRIVTWPLGFIIVASGRKTMLLLVEIAWTAFYVAMSWFLIKKSGLVGAGIAFSLSYLLHWALVSPIVHRITGFAWDRENRKLITIYLTSVGVATATFEISEPRIGIVIGSLLVFASAVNAVRQARRLVQSEVLSIRLRRIAGVLARVDPGKLVRANSRTHDE